MSALQIDIVLPVNEAVLWSAMREQDKLGPWPVSAVGRRADCRPVLVMRYLRKLLLAEIAVKVGKAGSTSRYRLQRTPALPPSLQSDGSRGTGTPQERLWRAIRMSKEFTPGDLAATCGDATPKQAATYCRALARAGVLVGKDQHFRLLRDLGPTAPRMIAVQLVVDPNAGGVAGKPAVREVYLP